MIIPFKEQRNSWFVVNLFQEIEIHKNEILLLEDHNLRQEKEIRSEA